MKLGAYYWDGWYARLPHWTERLLNEFTCRMPVWGWLGDTVENMQQQIDMAADAGLKFFAFDWYYPQNGRISGMNGAIDRFLQANNCNRLRQCLLVANHEGGRIFRDKWDDFCRMVLPYLTHETCLTVNGKPAIFIFHPGNLRDDLGGPEEARKCLDQLREQVKAAGKPGLCVISCCGAPRDADGNVSRDPAVWKKNCEDNEAIGFDVLSGYNYHRGRLKEGNQTDYIYPFEKLSEDYEYCWDQFATYSKLLYLPCVNGGWDCRPWEIGAQLKGLNANRSCYSPDRTPVTQYNHIVKTATWLKANSMKSADDLAIIYAWNENGEGGFIEPTIGDQGATLRAIARAIREQA